MGYTSHEQWDFLKKEDLYLFCICLYFRVLFHHKPFRSECILNFSKCSVIWVCSVFCLSTRCPFCLDNAVEASATTALSSRASSCSDNRQLTTSIFSQFCQVFCRFRRVNSYSCGRETSEVFSFSTSLLKMF